MRPEVPGPGGAPEPGPRLTADPVPRPFVFRPDPDVFFLRDIGRRPTPLTIAFAVFNLALFLLMESVGGATDPATLMAFGAKSNAAIDAGEVWRFVTPVFIHIGLLHLVFNTYALWIVGQQVEKLYGTPKFVVLYVVTGVGGVAGSYYFNPESVSAGASGAIFGLLGALLVFGLRSRKTVPAFLGRAIRASVLPLVLLNLLIGFAVPAIDNAAHIAGLVTGMSLAWFVGFEPPGKPTPRPYVLAQVAALALIAVCFGRVAADYDGPRAMTRFIEAVDSAERAFYASGRALRNNPEGLDARAADLAAAIESIRKAPSPAEDAARIIADLGRVLEAQFALAQDVRRDGAANARHLRRLEENSAAFRATIDELSEWVERYGGPYGLRVRDAPEGV